MKEKEKYLKKSCFVYLLFFVLIHSGCQKVNNQILDYSPDVIPKTNHIYTILGNEKPDKVVQVNHYFPESCFISMKKEWSKKYINDWYSSQLTALEEPIIYEDDSEKIIYRFTMLRTFHKPICVRIEKNTKGFIVIWKATTGAGGYDPGHLYIHKEKYINRSTWRRIERMIQGINFWDRPSFFVKNNGLDGSEWILEGKKKRYHMMSRWSPKKSDFGEVCMEILQLTDLSLEKIY